MGGIVRVLKRAAVAAGLLLLLAGLTPNPEADKDKEALTAAYKRCLQVRTDPATRITDCNKAIASRQLNVIGLSAALVGRAQALAALSEIEPAIADTSAAIQVKPDYWGAYLLRASLHSMGQRDHGKAIADLDKVIEANPNVADYYDQRGVAKDFSGQHEEAIADITKAITLHPRGAYYEDRGEAYVSLDRYKEAMADYDKSIQIGPDNPSAYSDRGRAHFDLGNYAAAAQDLARAVELSSRDPYFALWLYLAQAHQGDGKATAQLAEHARNFDLDSWPGPVVLMFLGKVAPDALKPARDPILWIELANLCEADFYRGQYELLHGERERAAASFQATVDTGVREYVEYHEAKVALKNLGR